MTLKTTLPIGLALVALAVGVQTAAAKAPDVVERAVTAKLASQSTPRMSPDTLERVATAAQANLPVRLRYSDSVDGANAARKRLQAPASAPSDVIDRAVAAKQRNMPVVLRPSDSVEGAIAAPDLPGTPVASSGMEIEWPQLGIGFGVGTLFALGLILAVRFGRSRTLSHG